MAVSRGEKLLRFWAPNRWAFLWLVFGLMPLFFFETFIHEGIHWVAAELDGSDPKLIPFAHYNTSLGVMRNLNGITLNSTGFVAMPQVVCLIILVGLIAVFIFTSPPWRWLRTFLVWWYLGLALDLLFNTGLGLINSPGAGTDWAKFKAQNEILSVAMSWLILAAIMSQVLWITRSRWFDSQPAGKGFFDYRGLAIAYGVLSLIALIVSWTIDDPSIDRNWWFWLVWSGQAVTFVGCVIYLWGLVSRGWSQERAVAHR
jgi:hypothetical protein